MDEINTSRNNIDPDISDQMMYNSGAWTLEENLKYAIFVDINKKSMTSKKKMRQMDFYNQISLFINTRSPAQCRSHHQKLFDKFKYISKIIQLFKNEVGTINYRLRYNQGVETLKSSKKEKDVVRERTDNHGMTRRTRNEEIPNERPLLSVPPVNSGYFLQPINYVYPILNNANMVYGNVGVTWTWGWNLN